ncbi:hypothetical protein Cob_v007115 [Colletotrichum orbiculare MAFF 240422]|uniref:Deoxyribonuclease NucA/NucB domain-containing protein n=1 Tax=Colletotrichum orbiculare (strain 104-T / ATCC 96160 / CBS 514.97 / LARS 414 / MAFF 240422) TaxID=1213857 RepID=N4V1K4_COLOR|nr:hypothetical protein Cob_v007115 [Colletotrichum orbiculare MAFF 240422]
MTLKPIVIFGLTLLAAVPRVAAAAPDVTFLCNRMPEVCTNMCWAVRCASPKFPTRLTWDNPNSQTEKDRRKSAGCGSNNKCGVRGKGKPGHRGGINNSCDEYPFASTSQSKTSNGHQVSRCVPGSQNSSQGGKLSGLYNGFKKKGYKTRSFSIGFGNPGSRGVKYCGNQQCKNDGFQVQDGKIKKRGEDPDFRFYKTSSGMILGSMEEIAPRSNFTREVDQAEAKLATLAAFDTWTEDFDGEDVNVISDIVLEEVSAEEAMKEFEK